MDFVRYNINDTITFSKDGTAIEHAGKADGSALSRSKGHYSVAGNKLTLHWTSGLKWDKIIKRWTAIKDPEETNITKVEPAPKKDDEMTTLTEASEKEAQASAN